MNLSHVELAMIGAAVAAIMMLGTVNIRSNLGLYGLQTFLIAVVTVYMGCARFDVSLCVVGLIVALVKAWFVPKYLNNIIRRVGVAIDSGRFIPAPLAMHFGILLLGASYLLAEQLSSVGSEIGATIGATAALSLISTGMLLMVIRNIAINQVVGFLVIENGIYLFSVTQTEGMPLAIEMGVLLDVLVGVMIAGLLLFRIKRNFEHIDVSKMTELRD